MDTDVQLYKVTTDAYRGPVVKWLTTEAKALAYFANVREVGRLRLIDGTGREVAARGFAI